ncbi:MAG: hypothetical protein IKW93_04935 [Bacteroidales bacterium]|nr:hypothetical protein [Bacteroidales bacterium]
MAGIIVFETTNEPHQNILSSVQNEFASEHRRIADYIRQDALPEFHQDDDYWVVIWRRDKKK